MSNYNSIKKVAIISARFYDNISDMLEEGAIKHLNGIDSEQGIKHEIITVPGALEIPALITMLIKSGRFDAYIALGCVIRGETSHYDIVCNESARGLCQLSMEYHAAIGNGILTVENIEQAQKRADPAQGNKGGFAANAALTMAMYKQKFLG